MEKMMDNPGTTKSFCEGQYYKDLGIFEDVGRLTHYFLISNGLEVITIPDECLSTSETYYAVPIWDTRWSEKENRIEAYIYGYYNRMKVPGKEDTYHVYFESEG